MVLYYEYTKNPAYYVLAYSWNTYQTTCYFVSKANQTWTTSMNWMMINGTVTASYFSPDYTLGTWIPPEGKQGQGLYWTGVKWSTGLWTTNSQPDNLYYPKNLMTVTPLTREFAYNTTSGGYLSYKAPLQLNSTNISVSTLPALATASANVTQNSLGRTGQLLGQPLPNSLVPT